MNGPVGATVVQLPALVAMYEMAVGLAAVMPCPHFPLTRTGPEKLGLSIGEQVLCAGLVWQLDPVIASGEPENAWKISESLYPPKIARSQPLLARTVFPMGRSQTPVTTRCCG